MQELEKYEDVLNVWIGEHCTVDALNVRLQGERNAIAFLQKHQGLFGHDELLHFCSLWNAECFDKPGVPRVITCSRFGKDYDALITSIEKNSSQYIFCVQEIWNALHCVPIDEIFMIYAKYINHDCIELLFSMLLYLHSIESKSKEVRYPWSRAMIQGMSYLFSGSNPEQYANYIVGITKPLQEKTRFSSKLSYAGYVMYCKYCDELRNYCNVYPQEVDFLLKLASEIE